MMSLEDITLRLREAATAVSNAELPEDLRKIAFERALDALGVGPSATRSPQQTPDAGPAGAADQLVDGLLARIAARLSLSEDLVSRVYENDNGQVRLILKRAQLQHPSSKAASMRDVGLLVVVGRQAAGLEEYTPYDLVREECRELKVYDQPNFATELARLAFRTQGGPRSKEARANRHHYDDAAQLIRLIGEAGS